MYLTAMIALAEAPAEAPPPIPSDFQLKAPARGERILPPRCRAAKADEIVVCGRDESDRLTELEPPRGIVDSKGGVIGTNVGNARIEPKLEEVEFPGGMISKRMLVTVRIPF